MTTQEQVDLDYYATFPEDDGEPMAETQVNSIQMIDLQWALLELARRQGRAPVAVGGNQLMYWNPHNGREHVSPDVYMVLDYKPPLPAKWQTWIEGKFPEIVFEISSPSTWRTDVGEGWEDKPALYKRRGVREYYIYDPQAAVQPALRGYGWVDEQWQRYELLPSGGCGARCWEPSCACCPWRRPRGGQRGRGCGCWTRPRASRSPCLTSRSTWSSKPAWPSSRPAWRLSSGRMTPSSMPWPSSRPGMPLRVALSSKSRSVTSLRSVPVLRSRPAAPLRSAPGLPRRRWRRC